jgi:predicted adenine nucleotide alpha hydrolase (AANH) superfamily ATPase
MSYYEEKMKHAEEVLKFAEKGFMEKVREIAEALSICPKKDVKAISDQLFLAVEAMTSAEDDVKYYKRKYEEEEAI